MVLCRLNGQSQPIKGWNASVINFLTNHVAGQLLKPLRLP